MVRDDKRSHGNGTTLSDVNTIHWHMGSMLPIRRHVQLLTRDTHITTRYLWIRLKEKPEHRFLAHVCLQTKTLLSSPTIIYCSINWFSHYSNTWLLEYFCILKLVHNVENYWSEDAVLTCNARKDGTSWMWWCASSLRRDSEMGMPRFLISWSRAQTCQRLIVKLVFACFCKTLSTPELQEEEKWWCWLENLVAPCHLHDQYCHFYSLVQLKLKSLLALPILDVVTLQAYITIFITLDLTRTIPLPTPQSCYSVLWKLIWITSAMHSAYCLASCPADWTERNGQCYSAFYTRVSFTSARSSCLQLGGDLVSLGDAAERVNWLSSILCFSNQLWTIIYFRTTFTAHSSKAREINFGWAELMFGMKKHLNGQTGLNLTIQYRELIANSCDYCFYFIRKSFCDDCDIIL